MPIGLHPHISERLPAYEIHITEEYMAGKYVFFDIDGTLWDRNRQMPESTARAIRQLRKNGHKAILNSGRSRANIHNRILDELEFDGVVAACGNHVEWEGKVLYERVFTDGEVDYLIDLLTNRSMPIVYEGPEYEWLNLEDFPDDPFAATIWNELGEYARRTETLHRPYRINKFTADYSPLQDPAREALHRQLEARYSYIDHDGRFIEIIPRGSSKAKGIQFLQEHLGIADDDVYAFGDGANDTEMLSYVTHSVAMGSGDPSLFSIAEYVTSGLTENGIENALRHYGLI